MGPEEVEVVRNGVVIAKHAMTFPFNSSSGGAEWSGMGRDGAEEGGMKREAKAGEGGPSGVRSHVGPSYLHLCEELLN